MRYEHRELIRSLEDLRRDAVGYLTAFTMTNGAVRHHPSDDSPARKTTLRAAQFFLDFPCDAIGMEQQNKLKSYAINTMCKTVLFDEGGCNHDSGLYDKEWALMIHPVSSTDPALDKELGNCVRIIENLEYLRETGESHEGSREWPHTIFFHLLDRVIVRFKDIGHRPDGIDLDAVQRRVWIRCADELYKQCVLFGADAMGQFDVAKMAFALAPAFNVVPMELMDNALQICADKLADAPNQIFSPYRIVTRDRYFRPLLEEVIAALLDAALVFLKRRRGTIDSIDNITRLVHGVAERALARKRTTTDARGWTAIDGPYRPEAWPTLAVAEFAARGEAFLRLYTLFRLRNQYGFIVRQPERALTSWSEYSSLPFKVHGTITQHMLNDEGSWRSAVLFGPPGTGKTSMVHAIARERGWDLVIITPADLAQEGPDRIIARVRELLEELSNAERIVVLLDEFEAFVRSRGAKEQEQLWMTMITNSMLPLLQGLRDRGIYCFLATNYVSIIDPAARRPGRFDALLPIWPPDRAGRRELIAKVRGGAIPNDKLDLAATVTKGCTVKELKTMCDSSDPQWAEGAGASELLEFESELKYARPPVDAKFD